MSKKMTAAAKDVLAERRRQIESEGWDADHDDKHSDGSLAQAAACYASNAATWAEHGKKDLRYEMLPVSFRWPWSASWWKPKSQRQDLVRAGALILAEIERLDRKGER